MNCEDFLDALTSSDERQRTSALSHAASCPSCAALADVHARLQKELAAPEPLPQRMRAAWEASAVESPQVTLARRAGEGRHSDRRLLPLFVLSTALGVLLLIALPLVSWHLFRGEVAKQPDGGPQTVPPPFVVRSIDASAELTSLLAEVSALEAELNKTSKHAELLDARREADVLLATHSQW